MKNNRAHHIFLLVTLCLWPLKAQPRLAYVAIVTRHGVRSPTWDNIRLNEYSAAPWPEWSVPPGNLTPHGRSAIALMGSYYRERLAKDRLLAARECADAGRVYVWADTVQRTLETGRALAESILPGCGVLTHSRPEGEKDPIFSGMSAYDPAMASEALRGRLGSNPQSLATDRKAAFETLQFVLDGGGPGAALHIDSSAKVGVALRGGLIDVEGPFATASTLTENLLLEYAEGMSGKDLGWGRLTKEGLLSVLGLHGVYADLTRRTPYLARTRASNLLLHVLRSLEQAASGKQTPGALGRPGDKVLILSGHDTNLSNISGMLDLSWSLSGYQKDETPPGGALVFSLWSDGGGFFVTTEYVAESLDQMRNLTPLTVHAPPLRQAVAVPACAGARADRACAWPAFQSALDKAIDRRFTEPN